MTRCICILLFFLTFVAVGPERSSAFSPSASGFATLAQFGVSDLSRIDDLSRLQEKGQDRGERRFQRFEQGDLGGRRGGGGGERKGFGAFWGGPYWGYGPRWGHRCESCRADCEGDQEGPGCKRCRVRCGW
jgi:hypothetical protein